MEERNVEFEWSDAKAEGNLQKHGVSFDEAETTFNDEYAYIYDDELHSDDEPRQVLVGYSARNRLLVVSFLEKDSDKIRLITARLASKSERNKYEETPRF